MSRDSVREPIAADALVLFGISGDLARRKLFPAIYRSTVRDRLSVLVVGVADVDWDDAALRAHVEDAVHAAIALRRLPRELHLGRVGAAKLVLHPAARMGAARVRWVRLFGSRVGCELGIAGSASRRVRRGVWRRTGGWLLILSVGPCVHRIESIPSTVGGSEAQSERHHDDGDDPEHMYG
jgi:hypothetical protein